MNSVWKNGRNSNNIRLFKTEWSHLCIRSAELAATSLERRCLLHVLRSWLILKGSWFFLMKLAEEWTQLQQYSHLCKTEWSHLCIRSMSCRNFN
jgi:hypothetical protein